MATILTNPQPSQVPDPPIARFLFADKRVAPVWAAVRLYVGVQWLMAGWGKITGEEGPWFGAVPGAPIQGFVAGALKQTTGAHPAVQPFYAWFLQHVVLPYAGVWSNAIAVGEVLVGLGLIVGLFTGFAAFFGGLMSANYLLAGAVSVNPLLFILATWLVLAWKVAGYWGFDFFALPLLGVPGAGGTLLRNRTSRSPTTVKIAKA